MNQSNDSPCDIDSDFSDGDSEEYTKTRLKNKALRHSERDKTFVKNHQIPENLEFITSMINYMKNETISTVNLDNSTIHKTLSHLFYQEDSFLNFEISQDKNFNLSKLLEFQSESFQMLRFPLEWLTNTVNQEGIKGMIQVKNENFNNYCY